MAEVTQAIEMRYVDKTKLIQYCISLWGVVDLQVCLSWAVSGGKLMLTQMTGRKLGISCNNPTEVDTGTQSPTENRTTE